MQESGHIIKNNGITLAHEKEDLNIGRKHQDMTKVLNCDILISEETVNLLERSFPRQREGTQAVKGHSRPVVVYRLIEGKPS